MAQQPHFGMKSNPTATGTATAMAPEPAPETAASGSAAERQLIARLAYQYWQERGCPDGSPEEDWLRAERDLEKGLAR